MTHFQRIIYIIYCAGIGFLIGMLLGELSKAAEPYKVAVIDSGFSYIPFDSTGLKLCNKGHYDFDEDKPKVGSDDIGHGAYVAALINRHAKTKNMCFLIYKVFGRNIVDPHSAVDLAILKANRAGAKAINMSLYMDRSSSRTERIIKNVTRRGIKVFVSAGNNGQNLNNVCDKYPVCFRSFVKNKNLMVVGAKNIYGDIARYSNYGTRIDVYELGDLSRFSRGTSFASPRALGNYIRSLRIK